MLPDLAIVELHFRDWTAAVAWFRDHFEMEVKVLQIKQQYALLGRAFVKFAIKGDADASKGSQVLLQFEVQDVKKFVAKLRQAGVRILKPLRASKEGYRRALIEGPEGIELLVFDWHPDALR